MLKMLNSPAGDDCDTAATLPLVENCQFPPPRSRADLRSGIILGKHHSPTPIHASNDRFVIWRFTVAVVLRRESSVADREH